MFMKVYVFAYSIWLFLSAHRAVRLPLKLNYSYSRNVQLCWWHVFRKRSSMRNWWMASVVVRIMLRGMAVPISLLMWRLIFRIQSTGEQRDTSLQSKTRYIGCRY